MTPSLTLPPIQVPRTAPAENAEPRESDGMPVPKAMHVLHAGIYLLWTFFCANLFVPCALLLPRSLYMRVLHFYFWSLDPLQRLFGVRWVLTGTEHLPDRPCLIALKHQSAWETLRLPRLFRDPAVIMKIELMRLPIWGYLAKRAEMIGIDRSLGARAVPDMIEQARGYLARGRDIVIFPQGTRVPVGMHRPYKSGIARMYEAFDCPVVPVALDSGVYTDKFGLSRRRGVITVRIMPAIEAGLDPGDMMMRLEDQIETASAALAQAVPGGNP